MRTSIVRIVGSAAAVAVPAVLGLGGLASADTFTGHGQQASPTGVSNTQTTSSTGQQGSGPANGDSGVSYDHNAQHAGPDGASSSGTHAATGTHGGSHQGGHTGHGGLINIDL